MEVNQITRIMEFDAGHRILGHESKCAHLHGHRYKAEVTVEVPELDKLGRVVDFGVVKQIVGGWIDANWDHNMILHPADPLLLRGTGPASDLCGRDPFIMPNNCNPTAENIAAYLWGVCAKDLPQPLKLIKVRLWETPTCFAEVF